MPYLAFLYIQNNNTGEKMQNQQVLVCNGKHTLGILDSNLRILDSPGFKVKVIPLLT